MSLTIAIWLTNPKVPAFRLEERHTDRLAATLGARVALARTEDEFLQTLPEADVVMTWRFRQEWFAIASRLRCIATPAAGHERFAHLRPPAGVAIRYGGFHGEFIAETVLGMMLAEVRGITEAVRFQQTGQNWPCPELAGRIESLRGSHAVIVGFGHIGEWIARLCDPFGVRITGIRRAPKPSRWPVRPIADLDRILPETDHLVLVLPTAEDSRNLIDARRLALLPRQAVIYSVGRGHCVDEAALANALNQGRLRAAYLDVFQTEPLPPESPLRAARGAVLMPHVSAISKRYMDRFIEEFLQEYRPETGSPRG